ncbi:LIM and SH3 domain protein Lasp-like, partial [Hyposmocoma kahamanoa]|uniref:LIM and SH3 domain protein Lasp-like n=1 Tax=Hyposmocoma kahamanoa TaxID=1477025 RepID=UPI000E6D993C
MHMRGFTVADDPETLRIKANTKIISNVAYHGDLEKKAQMERQRQINENGEIVDAPTDNYHQQIENYATEMLPPTTAPHLPPKNHYQTPQTQYQNRQYKSEYKPEQNTYKPEQNPYKPEQYRSEQYRPEQYRPEQYRPEQYRPEQYHPEQYRPEYRPDNYTEQYYNPKYEDPQYGYNYQQGHGQQKIGRIQDYDPLTDGPRTVPNTQRASATLIYNSTSDKRGLYLVPFTLPCPIQG